LLKSKAPVKGLALLESTGLLEQILPELYEVSLQQPVNWTRAKCLLSVLSKINAGVGVKLNVLLQTVPTKAAQILERLKFSNNEIKDQLQLMKNLDTIKNGGLAKRRRVLAESTAPHLLSLLSSKELLKSDEGLAALMRSLKPAEPSWISGQDLLAEGFKAGPSMGQVLQEVYDLQLEGKLRDKADALRHLKTLTTK
jgi:tRNA nucleotidyltransferase/poly(A) polymerase